MNVGDIMTSPPVTVNPTTSVAEIARIMLENHLSGVPVVDQDGTILGLVTQTELVAKHARVHLPVYFGILGSVIPLGSRDTESDIRRVLGVTAADIMIKNVPVISTTDSVDDAATVMIDNRINPLAVVDNDELVGVVSHADIIRLLRIEEGEDDVSGDATPN